MNRREFGFTAFSAAAVAIMPVSLTGCNTADTENTINTIIKAAQSIVLASPAISPWIGDVNTAVTAVMAAEAAWKGGSTIAIVESSLNMLLIALGNIPQTAAIAPLVAIAVAAIDELLNANATTTAASANFAVQRSANPYHGRVQLAKPKFYQSRAGAVKKQFNDTAVGIGLPQAQIK